MQVSLVGFLCVYALSFIHIPETFFSFLWSFVYFVHMQVSFAIAKGLFCNRERGKETFLYTIVKFYIEILEIL